MSLITLNSNGQNPSLFSCHFPQAINIEPYSQVCVLKFLHYRDSSVFNITNANNQLQYCIGNTNLDALRIARITPGEYTGSELALQIQDAMNNVLQQQNYNWIVSHIPEDSTASPPVIEGFKIEYESLALPATSKIPFNLQLGTNVEVNLDEPDFSKIELKENITDFADLSENEKTIIEPKGILLNEGSVEVADIGFDPDLFNLANAYDDDEIFGFPRLVYGICRNEISTLSNNNENLEFNPSIQDASITFNSDGVLFSSINFATGPSQ